MADVTRWRLEQLSDRLAELLSAEKNPQPTMEALARLLIEEGLSDHSPRPKESPETFARTVIAENPVMHDLVAEMPLPNLAVIETPEDLIVRLIPSRSDHG